MGLTETIKEISEKMLAFPFLTILLGSIVITIKTKFIQFRTIPYMIRLFNKKENRPKSNDPQHQQSLEARHALFTAISTSIGIGNVVGPAIAIKIGGPGALLYFILAILFGASTIFSEVTFALKFRKKLKDGSFLGGPMEYLEKTLGSFWAKFYAISAAIMLLGWTSTQSNSFADILYNYKIPHYITGAIMVALTLAYLFAGIKKIGELSAKIVPVMFILFCALSFWVIFANIQKLPGVLWLMFTSAFSPKAIGGAGMGIFVQKILRWGLAKGTQASEAGVGTTTIPHSLVENRRPFQQGILSMVGAYSVAAVCLLTGLVVLLAETWKDPNLKIGVSILSEAFARYTHPFIGHLILTICIFLFALGSIIGNSYNGGRCLLFLTPPQWVKFYYFAIAIILFLGAIFPVELIWSIADFFVIPAALINISGILLLLFKGQSLKQLGEDK